MNEERNVKRVIVTGGTGAIGTALIAELIRNGIEVTVLVRAGSARIRQIPESPLVGIRECALDELSRYAETYAEEPADAFFHLGWSGTYGAERDDMNLQLQNVRHTLDAVDLAKRAGCRVFVGVGSQAEYGRVPDGTRISASLPCNPQSGYGIAKYTAGKMSARKCAQNGIRHVWARLLSAYGPCDSPNTLVMSSVIRFLKGEDGNFTKGDQMWDYLYSGDMARALVAMAERGRDGKVYPVGSGTVRRLSEYITAIRDHVDPACRLHFGAIPYYPDQVMYLCADIDELTADTGFVPVVGFDEGIEKTVAWYKETQK